MRIAAVLALIMLVLSTLVGCGTATPQAKFTATPTNGLPPLEVQFSDKSTGNISSWQWDFGDDNTSTEQNPIHTYSRNGNYTVSLTVSGPTGNDTEVKKDYIQITRCPYFANFTIESIPENCQIQGNSSISCSGTTTVQFIDKSIGNVTAWAWDFNNDGVIDSTQQNPVQTYARNGNYTVTFTITTSECKDTLTKWDYINLTGCHT
jgi:PKD repeat protein